MRPTRAYLQLLRELAATIPACDREDWWHDIPWDAERAFIAAANPETVTALVNRVVELENALKNTKAHIFQARIDLARKAIDAALADGDAEKVRE